VPELLRALPAAVLALLTFLSLDVFLYHQDMLGFGAYWFDVALLGFGLLALVRAQRLYGAGIAALLGVYTFLSVLHIVAGGSDPARLPALQVYLFALAFLLAWAQLLADRARYTWVLRALWIALVVAAAMNLFEVFQPRTWSDSYGRSAGFFVNPNHAGRFGALAGAFLLATGAPPLRVFLLGTAVILPSLSRGSLLTWAAVLLAFLFATRSGRHPRAFVALVALLVVAGGAVFLLPQEDLQVGEMAARLTSLPGAGTIDLSTSSRQEAAAQSIELFLERPLIGHGPDGLRLVTWDGQVIGPHNEFLLAALHFGMIGLAAWLLYLRALGRGGGLPLLVAVAMLALTFHDLAANRQVLLLLLLAEAARRHGAEETADALQEGTA